MSKKLFYSCVCSALVIFSAYAQEEQISVQEDELQKEEQVLAQADAIEEEVIIEEEVTPLACNCKKRKKAKEAASFQFVSMTSENDEKIKEEMVEDEALAWANFTMFIHDATF